MISYKYISFSLRQFSQQDDDQPATLNAIKLSFYFNPILASFPEVRRENGLNLIASTTLGGPSTWFITKA